MLKGQTQFSIKSQKHNTGKIMFKDIGFKVYKKYQMFEMTIFQLRTPMS